MNLTAARATIAACPGQPETRHAMLAFIDSHPDALLRSCEQGHLTASALVVDHAGERVLLHLHAKLRRWLQLGGHCDGDGDLVRVAMREATEESGIQGLTAWTTPVNLDVHPFDATGQPVHLHYDVQYAVRAPAEAEPVLSAESRDLRWFAWDEALALPIDDGLRRLLRGARRLAARRRA